MQRRHEPHKSLDDFPTPPWATRALCEWMAKGSNIAEQTCRDPAANRGHMVLPLREYFGDVEGADIFDYGAGFAVRDYLFGDPPPKVDWTITNPPFRLAEQFIGRAINTSHRGVAVLVRSAFLEGVERHRRLFTPMPPARVLQFCERVPMVKGRIDPKASTATSYSWLVWGAPYGRYWGQTTLEWIAPCRKRLERASDWPAAPLFPQPSEVML